MESHVLGVPQTILKFKFDFNTNPQNSSQEMQIKRGACVHLCMWGSRNGTVFFTRTHITNDVHCNHATRTSYSCNLLIQKDLVDKGRWWEFQRCTIYSVASNDIDQHCSIMIIFCSPNKVEPNGHTGAHAHHLCKQRVAASIYIYCYSYTVSVCRREKFMRVRACVCTYGI